MPLASDDFNRADNLPPNGLGNNWTDIIAGLGIQSSEAYNPVTLNNRAVAYQNVVTTPNDQSSACVVDNMAGGSDTDCVGVTVRSGGTVFTETGYQFRLDHSGTNGALILRNSGAGSLLQSFSGISVSNGDVMLMTVVGTTIKCYVNSSQIGTDQTDSTLLSGQFGILIENMGGGGNPRIDSWVGDVAGTVTMEWALAQDRPLHYSLTKMVDSGPTPGRGI